MFDFWRGGHEMQSKMLKAVMRQLYCFEEKRNEEMLLWHLDLELHPSLKANNIKLMLALWIA